MPEQIDLAQQWQAFSQDRRAGLLKRMSPEQKKTLRAAIEGHSATATSGPEARTLSNYAGEAMRGVGRGLKDDVVGVYQTIRHPYDTATGMYSQAEDAADAAQREFENNPSAPLGQRVAASALTGLENAPLIGGMVQQAEKGGTVLASPESVGAAAEGITAFAAPEVAGRALSQVGVLRSKAANNVRGFAQENLDAGDEFARKTTQKYSKDVEDTKAQNQTATEKTLKDRGKVDQKNRFTERKDARDAARVKERNERAVAEHARKLREVHEHNRALEQSGAAQESLGGQVTEHSQDLDSRIQKAKVKAKGANDAEWKTVREKVGNTSVPVTDLASDVKQAEAKLAGSAESIKVFRDIMGRQGEEEPTLYFDGKAVEPGSDLYSRTRAVYQQEGLPTGDVGKPVEFRDLQGYYSELGSKISQGNLPGDVFQAMRSLRDSIGKRMQSLADNAGAGTDLTKAKEGFQKYMEAFSDSPTTKQTVASKVLAEASPDYVKERDQAARLEKVSQYDPEIAATASRIRGLRGQLKNLPTGGPKPLPEPPRLETVPYPSDRTPYAEPHANDAAPEAPDITAERRTQLQDKLKKYGRVGSWVGRVIFGGLAAAASHGDISRFSTDLVLGQGAMTVLTKALQSESVLDWLAKPSPKDVEIINQLPPDQAAKMRQALTGLAQEDLRRNPKSSTRIAPVLAAFMGMSNIGQPVKNRQEAIDLLKPHFDVETGTQ